MPGKMTFYYVYPLFHFPSAARQVKFLLLIEGAGFLFGGTNLRRPRNAPSSGSFFNGMPELRLPLPRPPPNVSAKQDFDGPGGHEGADARRFMEGSEECWDVAIPI